MFNKLKLNIKNKLIKFLELDKIIEDYNSKIIEVKENLDQSAQNIIDLLLYNKEVTDEKIESIHRTLQEVVKVGVDVDYKDNGDSWAVVCYNHGNTPMVKFINLRGHNHREITDYLKRFDAGSYKIDTPFRCGISEEFLYGWDK